MSTQTLYQRTILFATAKHLEKNQTIPGTELPYVVHLSNVAMEILLAAPHSTDFNIDLAVQVALLHDTLEDTSTTFHELETTFGKEVADGVAALTKDDSLAKELKMQDSLSRIKQQPKEIQVVKLADRITNLQKPPAHWSPSKIAEYKKEAEVIVEQLKGSNAYLENRLCDKIEEYSQYIK
ncbi:MAG: HD domain-containing protein [Cytophagaceae bacterium]